MNIFQTNSTGLWDGVVREARPDPCVDGEFLVPARAYAVDPRPVPDSRCAVWRDGAWVYLPDLRGTRFWTQAGDLGVITEIDTQIPEGCLQADPLTEEQRAWNVYKLGAYQRLRLSDSVAWRCFKAGQAFPQDWMTFTEALRTIVRASTGDASQPYPTQPDFPSNT